MRSVVVMLRFFVEPWLAVARFRPRDDGLAAFGSLLALPFVAHRLANGVQALPRNGVTLGDAVANALPKLFQLGCGICVISCHTSGHQILSIVQASADFHPHVVVTHLPFLCEFGIIEAKHEVLPEKF